MVINKNFAIKIPEEYGLEYAGPIFCSGITLYEPLRVWGATEGNKKVAVVGFGGLGVMGIKLALVMGNEVTVISTSENKRQAALDLGAKFCLVSNENELSQYYSYFDLILDTVSAEHDLLRLQKCLRLNGTLVILGLIPKEAKFNFLDLVGNTKKIAGSSIGGIKHTVDLLELCNKHKIYPEIEIVTSDKIDDIYKKLQEKNDSPIRYVLDIKKSLELNWLL